MDHAEQIVEVRKRIAERADLQALLTDTQTQSIDQYVRLLNLLLLLGYFHIHHHYLLRLYYGYHYYCCYAAAVVAMYSQLQ